MLAHKSAWAALFVFAAIALKISTFGDPNRHVDETFYFLIGQRMHEGLLVYVDMWDRKPLGLFLAYYLIAGISHSVVVYQVIACLLAAATAFVIAQIVNRWVGYQGAVLAGLTYLFIIGPFEGSTGQTPDFYNLMIATSALFVLQDSERLFAGRVGWRSWAAMALCGVAITFKQTTLFESAFFGLYILFGLYRAKVPLLRILAVGATCALIGAAPTLAIAAWYWQIGHWDEFWHAMVLSNLAKKQAGGVLWRAIGITVRAIILFVFAWKGLRRAEAPGDARLFTGLWLLAAVIGFLSVPNFFSHYTLPVLVPLSVAAGLFLGTYRSGLVIFTVFAFYATLWHSPLRSEWTEVSQDSMQEVAQTIQRLDSGGGMFLFDAPPYLYALTGKKFLSPLVFPHHFNHAIEHDVSHLPTHAEVERVLAAKPGVVVLERYPRNRPINYGSRNRVLEWVGNNCREVELVKLREKKKKIGIYVFGHCDGHGT